MEGLALPKPNAITPDEQIIEILARLMDMFPPLFLLSAKSEAIGNSWLAHCVLVGKFHAATGRLPFDPLFTRLLCRLHQRIKAA